MLSVQSSSSSPGPAVHGRVEPRRLPLERGAARAVSLAGDRTRDGFKGEATLLSNGCLFTLARVTALLHSLVSESVVCPLEFPPEVSSFSLSD